jgi:hypothetical protein
MSNNDIIIIQTEQAPDAKPVGVSRTLDINWQKLIEVPAYEVPEQTFGGTTVIAPGVAEIISPLLACNKTPAPATISLRMYRADTNTHFLIANEIPIDVNDLITIPLNGQFIYTGDTLEAKTNIDDAIDITISYTVGEAEQDDVV